MHSIEIMKLTREASAVGLRAIRSRDSCESEKGVGSGEGVAKRAEGRAIIGILPPQ
jgi:hypothetical protein